ncbi:MAG: ATP-grasp domain-containing protein [Chloroflexi bacterium]|jgi:biotin carboxylase|nr:ATP-grasp domain-containing protein [Chloroflexota bacterium]
MTNRLSDYPCRILLLTTTRSYRGPAFLSAAEKLDIEIVQGINMPQELATEWSDGISLDFSRPEAALDMITTYAQDNPLSAILAIDDSGGILAAKASAALNLPHNGTGAVEAASNKFRMRQLLHEAGVPSPQSRRYNSDVDPQQITQETVFPCVVKPLTLNGSRGVIRANNPAELLAAINRTTRLIRSLQGDNGTPDFLVETYIPGVEVALEGLLENGRLRVLALFDKPDPLEGPFFEETIYVTPSRLPVETQAQITETAASAAAALGLRMGPIHAELRTNDQGACVVEIAGRSIGGLCSRTLQFGTGGSLEELILRQACRLEVGSVEQTEGARGVMMIPIPEPGLLRGVKGKDAAESISLVQQVEITARINYPLVPLPEGDGYLGFIFASGQTAEEVENALRLAHAKLRFDVDPLLPMLTQ